MLFLAATIVDDISLSPTQTEIDGFERNFMHKLLIGVTVFHKSILHNLSVNFGERMLLLYSHLSTTTR